MLGSRSNSFSGAPHLSYARYTDVAVEMYRGVETTPATGRNRVYAATLSGPASGGAGNAHSVGDARYARGDAGKYVANQITVTFRANPSHTYSLPLTFLSP